MFYFNKPFLYLICIHVYLISTFHLCISSLNLISMAPLNISLLYLIFTSSIYPSPITVYGISILCCISVSHIYIYNISIYLILISYLYILYLYNISVSHLYVSPLCLVLLEVLSHFFISPLYLILLYVIFSMLYLNLYVSSPYLIPISYLSCHLPV